MRQKRDQYQDWDEEADARYAASLNPGRETGYDEYQDDDDARALQPYDDDERALQMNPPPPLPSLVGVSATVTNYGSPLLSYSRTMARFYQGRRQVMSLGRFKCAICGERIGGWAWLAPNGGHAHDGCYDRLAWAWASVYAEQRHMAARGELE